MNEQVRHLFKKGYNFGGIHKAPLFLMHTSTGQLGQLCFRLGSIGSAAPVSVWVQARGACLPGECFFHGEGQKLPDG